MIKIARCAFLSNCKTFLIGESALYICQVCQVCKMWRETHSIDLNQLNQVLIAHHQAQIWTSKFENNDWQDNL